MTEPKAKSKRKTSAKPTTAMAAPKVSSKPKSTTKAKKPQSSRAKPNPKPAGRKLILDKLLIDRIEPVLMTGASIKDACEYVGISQSAFFLWLQIAELIEKEEFSDPSVPTDKKTHPLYLELLERVKKARAQARVEALAVIRVAATRSWQAAAWFLERSNPEEWGRRVIDTNNKHEGEIKVTVVREKKPPPAYEDDDDEDGE